MIEEVCPWELSKRLVNLGFSTNSFYKWVHPWQNELFKENKRRFIVVDSLAVSSRVNYPAYTIEEILENLPEGYILGRVGNKWYCKYFFDGRGDIIYHTSPILACAYAALCLLEKEEDCEGKEK